MNWSQIDSGLADCLGIEEDWLCLLTHWYDNGMTDLSGFEWLDQNWHTCDGLPEEC